MIQWFYQSKEVGSIEDCDLTCQRLDSFWHIVEYIVFWVVVGSGVSFTKWTKWESFGTVRGNKKIINYNLSENLYENKEIGLYMFLKHIFGTWTGFCGSTSHRTSEGHWKGESTNYLWKVFSNEDNIGVRYRSHVMMVQMLPAMDSWNNLDESCLIEKVKKWKYMHDGSLKNVKFSIRPKPGPFIFTGSSPNCFFEINNWIEGLLKTNWVLTLRGSRCLQVISS